MAQLRAVLEDIGVDAVKTGMLATGDIIRTVAGMVREFGLRNLIVDPVMIAASGDSLMQHEAAPVMREHLFPLATVVTPNLDEATFLCERKIRTVEEMQEAARAIHAMGPRYVLIKGGHLPGDKVVDLLFDGREFVRREGSRIRGLDVRSAVAAAQNYIALAIQTAPAVGKGRRPLNHFPEGFVPPEARR
jgi:hydroxymethylpyrimidine/phosphomethylpyrimidine kinase